MVSVEVHASWSQGDRGEGTLATAGTQEKTGGEQQCVPGDLEIPAHWCRWSLATVCLRGPHTTRINHMIFDQVPENSLEAVTNI